MRRLVSILLIGLFSFSLMAPLLLALDADAQLPECCRRAGKHRCSTGQLPEGQRPGANLTAICRLYSHPGITAAIETTRYLKPAAAFLAAIHVHLAVHAVTLAHYRIPYSRSRQKRGPPQFLS